MADNKQKSKNNLIDLASERQRMQQRAHVQKGKKLTRSSKGPEKPPASGIRWYHYLELILFLMAVAYLMQMCRG